MSQHKKKQGIFKKFSKNTFGSFLAESYRDREFLATRDESTKTIITDGGEQPIVWYKPVVVSRWRCEYFNSPQQNNRLFIHMCLAATMAVILGVISLTVRTPNIYAAIGVLFLLFLNFFFRLNRVAIFGKSVPRIPFFSDLYLAKIINGLDEERYEDDEEEEDEENSEKKNKKSKRGKQRKRQKKEVSTQMTQPLEDGEVTRVVPVEDINNGFPSPATVLTRWMNGVAQWSSSDLIESSGGILDTFKVRQLVKNNPDAWTDPHILDVVSRVTNSHPLQWRKTLQEWQTGVESP